MSADPVGVRGRADQQLIEPDRRDAELAPNRLILLRRVPGEARFEREKVDGPHSGKAVSSTCATACAMISCVSASVNPSRFASDRSTV